MAVDANDNKLLENSEDCKGDSINDNVGTCGGDGQDHCVVVNVVPSGEVEEPGILVHPASGLCTFAKVSNNLVDLSKWKSYLLVA